MVLADLVVSRGRARGMGNRRQGAAPSPRRSVSPRNVHSTGSGHAGGDTTLGAARICLQLKHAGKFSFGKNCKLAHIDKDGNTVSKPGAQRC